MICSRNMLTSSVKRGPRSRWRVERPPSGRPEAAPGAERPGLPHVPALTREPRLGHLMRFAEAAAHRAKPPGHVGTSTISVESKSGFGWNGTYPRGLHTTRVPRST